MKSMRNAAELMELLQLPDEKPLPSTVSTIRCPVLGRIHFVRDPKGIMQLMCVLFYWVYGTFSSLFIILIPRYAEGYISGIFLTVFMSISLLCLTSLIRVSTLNPGRIPTSSIYENEHWTYCRVCNRKRPQRAHHCRRCGQCVMKMDHHCPWINNCVGEQNHYAFFLLLLYAFLLSAVVFLLCMLHFWVYPKCKQCDKDAFYVKHSIWFLYLLTLMAANMTLVMGIQLIGQHFNLLIDRTTLENIQQPPDPTRIQLRGTFAAYEEMCGRKRSMMFLWFIPCKRRTLFSGGFSSQTV
ncbi:palmitoyltransferase ZDHHC21-like isoform X1 [Haliotis rubra]|uniref:palmitoyltransferase ZDHHC21-like isoform X1 n=1 Tax=Haliotis rubra TaxID=36100 RepID=UPI001EE5A66E|nr:palmitoyltransferase ZDHHC21-like isoform X1 [Haliotis rubra]XP_046549036.1 palmitoyltransferase ZDHHC21-like isoform X1 [Haliotis rubra]XP_046549037.1 palmitoyltransferase ZDHHC21-like isoform X1 [Haliotis rubra]XP_046549038.1 palmitoyltransferase ZDHHC21-like isoform X1 [Haliotis rubra]